jgi:hypothetical protein
MGFRSLFDSSSGEAAIEGAQRPTHPLRGCLKQQKRSWRNIAEFWSGVVDTSHFSLECRLERIVRQTILCVDGPLRNRVDTRSTMLPYFLILGAQRAGTSSLYKFLRQHPSLRLPRKKEIHFFDLYYTRGLRWYARQFPAFVFKRKKKTGEATPYYLFHPAVAERVADALPDVKLIALLRDPTARAYSHFQMSVFKGNETILDFEAALAAEHERLQGETENLMADPDYFSFFYQKHSYYARGLYCQQLKHWMRFFQRSRLHVTQNELLFDDSQAELDKLVLFWGWKVLRFLNSKRLTKATTRL